MSKSFNKRFALEQAVILHARTDYAVNEGVRRAVIATADHFIEWLEKADD